MSRRNKLIHANVKKTQLIRYPYALLRKEIKSGYSLFTYELLEIQQSYNDYYFGADFIVPGSSGDYVSSDMRFKIGKTIIDKEARFMFSQQPDMFVHSVNKEEKKEAEQYQRLINKVFEQSKFYRDLVRSAKDCFVGRRIAILVDYSEQDGIQTHFYNSLQFYHETDYGSDRLTKLLTFEYVENSKSSRDRTVLCNKYEVRDGIVYMSSVLYDGMGKEKQVLIPYGETPLKQIPAVVIINDGTLFDVGGVSEMDTLSEGESYYSRMANGDMDSENKNMSPIRFTVDMNPATTKGLSSSAGSYWDLHSDQQQNEVHPQVGTLSPSMQHSEPVKITLDRIKTMMYSEVDVPNITEETMVGTVTSGKTLEALYWPLSVRCDEKMKAWGPALSDVMMFIIEYATLNPSDAMSRYGLESLKEIQYRVTVEANYALMQDELEEKAHDLQEIATNTRSRLSYMKKWRRQELEDEADRQEELLQIAKEINMFDTMSINSQVQSVLEKESMEEEIKNNLDDV